MKNLITRNSSALVLTCALLAVCVPASAQDMNKMVNPPNTSQVHQFADAVKALAAAQSPASSASANNAQNQTASANLVTHSSRVAGKEAEAKTLAGLLSYDSDLNQAVDLLLAQQTSPTRPPVDAARFATVRTLVITLCASNPPLKQQGLQQIYDHGDQASDRDQLRENEQLGHIIHMAYVRSGLATYYDYDRTAACKRIVRRRFYLNTHPDEERKP